MTQKETLIRTYQGLSMVSKEGIEPKLEHKKKIQDNRFTIFPGLIMNENMIKSSAIRILLKQPNPLFPQSLKLLYYAMTVS